MIVRNRKEELITETGHSQHRPSLVINALSNWTTLGISIVLGLLLTPYIISCLGTARYGIWTLISSLIGYYGLLDLGVGSAIVRYVARYAGQREYRKLNEAVNTALAMFCLAGLIIVALSIFLAKPLAGFFHIVPENYQSFIQVIWLLGITAGLMFPGNALSTIIIAHERFVIANFIRIASVIFRGCFTFLVLYKGGGLVAIGWVNAGVSIFTLLANALVVKACFKHIDFSLKWVNRPTVLILLSFGLFTTIRMVGGLLRTNMDAAVIGRYINTEAIGVYSISALLFGYLMRIVISVSGTTQPKLASIAGYKQKQLFKDSVLRYSMVISNLSAGLGLVIFLLAGDFLKLWVPENFKDVHTAKVAFYILLIGLIPHLMTNVSVNALEAVNKHRYYAYQTIVEGVANLVLSILLVGPFGIYGVAIGTTIPILITKIIVQPIYCCKIMGIKWSKYMLDILLKPILLIACLGILFNKVQILFVSDSYFMLIVNAIVIFIVYAILSFIFCLDSQTRQLILAKWRNVVCGFGILKKKPNTHITSWSEHSD